MTTEDNSIFLSTIYPMFENWFAAMCKANPDWAWGDDLDENDSWREGDRYIMYVGVGREIVAAPAPGGSASYYGDVLHLLLTGSAKSCRLAYNGVSWFLLPPKWICSTHCAGPQYYTPRVLTKSGIEFVSILCWMLDINPQYVPMEWHIDPMIIDMLQKS